MIQLVTITMGAESRQYRVQRESHDTDNTCIARGKRRFRKDMGMHPCSSPKELTGEVVGSPILPGFSSDRDLFAHFEPRGGAVTTYASDDFNGYVVRMPHERLIHFYRPSHPTGPLEPWSFIHQSSGHYDEHSRFWSPELHQPVKQLSA